MNILKKGFTLVEVMIFLAISGALLAGIIISTSSVVDKQRYYGSVQHFVDFFQNIYAEVTNPKNNSIADIGPGRSNKVIYGKLITFGEANTDDSIFVYTVVGQKDTAKGATIDNAMRMLRILDADIFYKKDGDLIPYGMTEQKMVWDIEVSDTEGDPFVGAVLIIRSPASGVVYTYSIKGKTVEGQQILSAKDTSISNGLAYYLDSNSDTSFSLNEVDFCISQKGNPLFNNTRYNVRMTGNSRDASGVALYSMDDLDEDTGNRCRDY